MPRPLPSCLLLLPHQLGLNHPRFQLASSLPALPPLLCFELVNLATPNSGFQNSLKLQFYCSGSFLIWESEKLHTGRYLKPSALDFMGVIRSSMM